MPATPRQDTISAVASTEERPPQHGPGSVALRLTVDPGDPLAGSIAVEGQPEKRFGGWIELMAAINAARAADEDRPP